MTDQTGTFPTTWLLYHMSLCSPSLEWAGLGQYNNNLELPEWVRSFIRNNKTRILPGKTDFVGNGELYLIQFNHIQRWLAKGITFHRSTTASEYLTTQFWPWQRQPPALGDMARRVDGGYTQKNELYIQLPPSYPVLPPKMLEEIFFFSPHTGW